MQNAFEKLAEIRSNLSPGPGTKATGDEFLSAADLVPVHRQVAGNRLRAVKAEMAEIFSEKRWQQAIDLFFPVEEKLPELTDLGLEAPVREKVAFALGQLGRYDDAIAQLRICVVRDPENFHCHSALAYTAYNSLFAARNREILLSGKVRDERMELACAHFEQAQRLRPDGVTNFYRHGMLQYKLRDKSRQALPLFERAVSNWEALPAEEKERRHQEHKNYVKALYQGAGIRLADGNLQQASAMLRRCLTEDEKSDHLSRLHKYFALGKVEYHSGRFQQARDALLFAEKCRNREPIDFVYELLARVYLGIGNPDKALAAVQRVPEGQRRPYFRWTEADVLCALKEYSRAKAVLGVCIERDRRSRHKGLIRLCKIEYLLGEYRVAAGHAQDADRFFRENWGNAYGEGLFWSALSLWRAGEGQTARQHADELRSFWPAHPKLDRLFALLEGRGDGNERRA